MSEGSKLNAIEKLNAMKFNVGAPDTWIEEGFVDFSEAQTVLDDVLAVRRARFNLKSKMLGRPSAEMGFYVMILDTPLSVVNAFYVPNFNCMCIYPAYMLTPSYDPQQNSAHNYATMMCWGHEVIHGFDTNGARYNKQGDLEEIWASNADSQEFQRRAQQLINLYSSLDVIPLETGLKNDGAYTAAENVADLGGFLLAYHSYLKYLKKNGFKGEQYRLQQQRFYEAFAYLWTGKWSAEDAQRRTEGIGEDHEGKDAERILWGIPA